MTLIWQCFRLVWESAMYPTQFLKSGPAFGIVASFWRALETLQAM